MQGSWVCSGSARLEYYDLLDAVIWRGSPLISHSSVVSVWIGGVDLANAALASIKTKKPLAVKHFVTSYRRNLSTIFTQIKKGSVLGSFAARNTIHFRTALLQLNQ